MKVKKTTVDNKQFIKPLIAKLPNWRYFFEILAKLGIGLMEMEILDKPLDAIAHELTGEIHGLMVAARLEEESASGLVGQVRVFVQIHAVALLEFGILFHGGLGFVGGRGSCGFFTHERCDEFFSSPEIRRRGFRDSESRE
jgi:hypothetical protein